MLGRVLSPDPYVQSPLYSQDYNRYTYARNNPLIYTDPDGEWVDLALFIIGVGIMKAIQNGQDMYGKWNWKEAGIGFVQGAALAGSMVGSVYLNALPGMLSNLTPFTSFLLYGGTSFVSSASTSGITSWNMTGKVNVNRKGAAISAGVSGLMAGIQSQRQLISFSKGNKTLGINASDPVPATDDFIDKAQKVWYKKAPRSNAKVFTVENVPSGVQADMDAAEALGATRPRFDKLTGKLTGYSSLYFNKNFAFSSAETLFYAMGHEFVHVSQYAALAGSLRTIITPDFIDMLDYHAYSYQNILGGLKYNSFTGEEIIRWQNSYIQYNSMQYIKFGWTYETTKDSFFYPF
jgi:hypothetical protein